ncbi:MAG: hypothetical protein AAF487_00210 [Bacteroidota bacterium]
MRAVRNVVLGIFLCSLFGFTLENEDEYKKQVKLKVIAHTYENLHSDITLDVFKSGELVQEDISNAKNKFNLVLDLNEEYDVKVNQPGCQSKSLKIDTRVDGFTKGNLSYVIEIYMKKEIVGSLEEDKIRFHLFHGINDKTLLMLADN